VIYFDNQKYFLYIYSCNVWLLLTTCTSSNHVFSIRIILLNKKFRKTQSSRNEIEFVICRIYQIFLGTFLIGVGWGTALQAGMSRVRFPKGLLEFWIENHFGHIRGHGIDSASSRNEYHGYHLGGKGDRCLGLTTSPFSCADCVEILGSSNT
jgi:hypothetical protein